jgi:hypothetical protein
MKDKSQMLSPKDFPKMKKRVFPKIREPPKLPEFPEIGKGYQFPTMEKREFPKIGTYEFPEMEKYKRFQRDKRGSVRLTKKKSV